MNEKQIDAIVAVSAVQNYAIKCRFCRELRGEVYINGIKSENMKNSLVFIFKMRVLFEFYSVSNAEIKQFLQFEQQSNCRFNFL